MLEKVLGEAGGRQGHEVKVLGRLNGGQGKEQGGGKEEARFAAVAAATEHEGSSSFHPCALAAPHSSRGDE